MDVRNQHIAVLGLGESGESAAKLLRGLGAKVTALDSGDPAKLAAPTARLEALGIQVIAGAAAEADPAIYDRVILSPGIDPKVPLVENVRRKNLKITGELELSYVLCGKPVVAITGTNGKTTTTQLVEAMFKGCEVKTTACGNIGPAFAAKVLEGRELDVMTVEVSSFQLEEIETFHPKIAVWLGFAPDHLDRYPDMKAYYAAKIRVFENQTESDWAVVNARDPLPELKARRITFSAYSEAGDFRLRGTKIYHGNVEVLDMRNTHLRGSHNAENVMAALGVGMAWGLTLKEMRAPIEAYRPLPHRCELVCTINGVDYINDSKATNLDSLEKALAGETRPVVLIAGGKDKGFAFDAVTDLVAEKCRCAVLLGELADRIEALWKNKLPCQNAGRSLEHAVDLAHLAALPGDIVLFSPGTSSFDMFKNYGERGNQFRTLVQSLQPNQP